MDKHDQEPLDCCGDAAEKPATVEELRRELIEVFLPKLAAAMDREKVKKLKPISKVVGGRKFTMNSANAPADGLPPKVAVMSKEFRRIYLALRDARSQDGGAEEPIWQTDLFLWIRNGSPKNYPAKRTVFRAIKVLHECGELRRDDDLGYFVVGQQLALPF